SQDKLRSETGALVAALRKPQARGRWGEMQLRNVVEMAGMVAYCDFAEQVTVRDDDRTLRPDLIVNMPGGKKVVVDAKAPLQAFLDAYDATGEPDRERHMAEHARMLREHIRKLGRELHSRRGTVAGYIQKLGRQLGGAVDAYNAAVGSIETRVLVSARRFTDHGVVGEDKQIAPLEPIDRVPRVPQAPELAPV